MSDKSDSPHADQPVLAVFDEATMAEVKRLAVYYGVDVGEVLAELIRMDLERPKDATVH